MPNLTVERGLSMKVVVEKDLCISCGLCMNTCPDVFEWDENEKAKALPGQAPPEMEDSVKEAIDSCPTTAIFEQS